MLKVQLWAFETINWHIKLTRQGRNPPDCDAGHRHRDMPCEYKRVRVWTASIQRHVRDVQKKKKNTDCKLIRVLVKILPRLLIMSTLQQHFNNLQVNIWGGKWLVKQPKVIENMLLLEMDILHNVVFFFLLMWVLNGDHCWICHCWNVIGII